MEMGMVAYGVARFESWHFQTSTHASCEASHFLMILSIP